MKDSAAIALVHHHLRTVEWTMNRMCVPEHDRDDIRQEVAWRAVMFVRHRGVIAPQGNSGLIARMSRHACIARFRKAKHHLRIEEAVAVADGSMRPDELLSRKQAHEELHRAIACLTPLRRQVVRRVMQGESMVEIARDMKRSHGSVKVLHHYAVNDLRKLLAY